MAEDDANLPPDIHLWTRQAESGSDEHQYKLGAHYLKLAESDIDREDNVTKAVTWLLAASKKGHAEATEKLRHCVDINIGGINEKNKSDVKWCLKTSLSEKKIRHAAKSLFSKISNTDKRTLSHAEYVEAIRSLDISEREKKLLLAAGRKIGDTVSENAFVKTLSRKINGTLTWTAEEKGETSAAYDSAGLVKKIFVYPKQTAAIMFDQGLEYASKEGLNLLMSLIPYNQIYLLAMILIYSCLTPNFFLFVVPLLTFYISTLTLVVATLQMFYKKRKKGDSTILVSMLQEKLNVDIDIESTESQYLWNSLTPYLVFFGTLPVMIASFSLANKSYIPCGELFVVSVVMTVFCFIGLNDNHDLLTLTTLLAHGVASLPVFFSSVPNIPVVSGVISFLTQPFFSVELGHGLTFNLSFPSIVHMLIPILLLRMAMQGSWSGAYKILIPHLVCYFWFSISTTTFPLVTFRSLIRATFGYLLLPLAIPVSFFLSIGGIFYLVYKLFMTETSVKILITAVLFGVSLLLTQSKSLFGKKSNSDLSKSRKLKKILMVVFAVLGLIQLLYIPLPTFTKPKHFELSWEDFKEMCLPGPGDIWAPYQMRCQDFVGLKVRWKGTTQQVKITKVENTIETVIKSLPTVLSDPLYSIYGDKLMECNELTIPSTPYKHCQAVKSMGKVHHLRSQNQYTFYLSISVDGYVLNVDAGSSFKGKLMALKPGDELEFTAALVDVGTPSPILKLKSFTCTSRELNGMLEIENEVDESTVYKMLTDAFGLTINFCLFPVFAYSTETV
ncbi:hypothetical protein Btru_028023 [Bulinus truncatus]|nr:hypothetical protein Btru_028023 [Bulinus truncatus]